MTGYETMGDGLIIGLAQLSCVEGDKRVNIAAACRAIDEAAGRGVALVVLPELHTSGFVPKEQLAAVAEEWPGLSAVRVIEHGAGRGVGVVTSFPELDAASGAVFNTTVVSDSEGRTLATYRKAHLFEVERDVFVPGEALADVFTFEGLRLGLLVCFDIEFPEPARRLALAGAQVLVVPSANMDPWGPRHRTFVTARAIENHVFVAYCNRRGPSTDFTFPGQSAIVDPMGHVVCEAGADDAVVCGAVDPAVIAESRSVFDYLAERRPGLYGGVGLNDRAT